MACSGCKKTKQVVVKKNKKGKKVKSYTLSEVNAVEKLNVFHTGSLQDYLNFKKLCEENNITDAMVQEYIDQKVMDLQIEEYKLIEHDQLENMVKTMNRVPACPKCGYRVEFMRVNTMPCNMVGGKYKFVVYCEDVMGCGWEYYSRENDAVNFIRRNRRVLDSQLVTYHEIKEL